MRFISSYGLILLMAMPVQAEFRAAQPTKTELAELERRCQMHSQNEEHDTKLVWGKVLQTRFSAPKVKTCIPKLEKPCERYDWYPKEFVGVLTDTNRHAPADKVFFMVSGFDDEQLRSLDFRVGYNYAFCAELQPRKSPQYPPKYLIYNYDTIYELK